LSERQLFFYHIGMEESMIESTFIIAPGVGPKRERAIWSTGIRKWSDFMDSASVEGITDGTKRRCDTVLSEAYRLLDDGNAAGLGDMLKSGEQWRLWDRFGDRAAFLDIETDGLERDSTVTVVTVHKKNDTVTLINGKGLDTESLACALDGCSMLVTFNGSCFDVPVLRNSFPSVSFDMPHFDLRFACRKVGMTGGLKRIERTVGIERSDAISDVDGEEAVRLWNQWKYHGDRQALDTLAEYNRADTINLEKLSDIVYRRLVRDYAGFGTV
jgi:uncharacterized protein YprB with RNaseH-like and TPR domain